MTVDERIANALERLAELLELQTRPVYMVAGDQFELDRDLVDAIAWCRLGGSNARRPSSDEAFQRAKNLGLLAQDPIWRATDRGEGVLIAAGLLEGSPEPELVQLEFVWGTDLEYPHHARFVAAFTSSEREHWTASYERRLAEAQEWFAEQFGPHVFFVTPARVARPEAPVVVDRGGPES